MKFQQQKQQEEQESAKMKIVPLSTELCCVCVRMNFMTKMGL
jgi:hypothetical protein